MARLENYLNEAIALKEPSDEEVKSLLLKDCKKFLRETSWAFYRGSDIGPSSDPNVHRMKARPMVGKEMRAPKDTPMWVHKLANKAFKETWGWSPRQGVFASNMSTASSYGRGTFLFFPIGNYDYLWSSSVRDFFATGLDSIGPAKYGGNKIDIFVETLKERVDYWKERERDAKIGKSQGLGRFARPIVITDVANEWQPYFKHFYLGKVRVSKSSVQKYTYNKLLEVTKLYTNTGLEEAIKKHTEVSFRVKEYYLLPGFFQMPLTTGGFDQIGNWARRA